MPRVEVEGELPGYQPYLIHNNGDMKVVLLIILLSVVSLPF